MSLQKIQLNPIQSIFQGSLLFAYVSYQTICQLLLAQDYKQKAGCHHQGQKRKIQPCKSNPCNYAVSRKEKWVKKEQA